MYKILGFNWVKTNKDGSIYKGMGWYTRSNAEICLIATRGKRIKRKNKSVSNIVIDKRCKEHSCKPDKIRNLIEDLYGDLPRIELFARDFVSGWDSLGIKIRERRIKDLGIRVDGFDHNTNTVYEFLGDYWHGNPKKYAAKKINPHNKKTFGKLYKEWLNRKTVIEDSGYTLVYIWETDFNIKTV